MRDRATGRPLPGAVIVTVAVYERDGNHEGWGNLGGGSATADAQGRFRLVGAPKSRDLGVHVFPPEGQPYLERMEHVGDTPGLAPIVHDVSLTRGIPVRGRLIDQVSGRPVRGVVHYFLLDDQPAGTTNSDGSLSLCQVPTGDDGSFSIVALDGPGLLAASSVLRPVHQGRRRRSIQGGETVVQHWYVAPPTNADPKFVRYPGRARPARRLERRGAHDRAHPVEVTRAACGLDRARAVPVVNEEPNHDRPSRPLGPLCPRRRGALGPRASGPPPPPRRFRRHLGRDPPRPGRRPRAQYRPAPLRHVAHPGRAGTLREARRRRGRLCRRRYRTAQGLVGLPHALRARPAGRAAGAHVAQPFRHQRGEGQRPGMDAAAERDVPPPCPGAVRRAPPGLRS